ncbi:MAG: RHS repeat-associated core domain-containing protein [Planctomycetota bacterium]
MEIDGSAYTSADVAYLYDDAYQLTSEVRTGGDSYTQTYLYDASGNRTKKTLGGTDTTYLYNTTDQLTSETTGGTTTEYEYDTNGNLTKADDSTTTLAYAYDVENRMTSFSKSASGASAPKRRRRYYVTRICDNAFSKPLFWGGFAVFTPVFLLALGCYMRYRRGKESLKPVFFKVGCVGLAVMYLASMNATVYAVETTSASYAYDADGRRMSKTVDGTQEKFFFDGHDVIADYDSDDTLVATYLTPSLDHNVSQSRSSSTYYYLADGLGSIRNLLDSNEATQNTYDYYAFGDELGTWTENVTNRYTFTAREWDEESSTYYYRARVYSALGGAFLGRDPAFQVLLSGVYRYVTNNPVNETDPTGQFPTGITLAIIIIILALLAAWQIHETLKAKKTMGNAFRGSFLVDAQKELLYQTGGDTVAVAGFVEMRLYQGGYTEAVALAKSLLSLVPDQYKQTVRSAIRWKLVHEWQLIDVNKDSTGRMRSKLWLQLGGEYTDAAGNVIVIDTLPGTDVPLVKELEEVTWTLISCTYIEEDVTNAAEQIDDVRKEWQEEMPTRELEF